MWAIIRGGSCIIIMKIIISIEEMKKGRREFLHVVDTFKTDIIHYANLVISRAAKSLSVCR